MMPWWWPFGQVPEVTPEELSRRLRSSKPPQLVDVRSGPEHGQGHIPGVKLVPLPELPQRVGTIGLDPHRPVVAICKSGHRSRPAVRLLRRAGYDAVQLAGGMDAWRRQGGKETRPRGS